ncbi:hypothetical protein C7N43_16750 [Sphingobacteriales bacterium UPWRP_1]|nr:hypothetical protein C7N43_16750 [Sphingobacteriales bacterium UPWRP_1]
MSEQLLYNISLNNLTLKSFRCFPELDVSFDERLTVFIAENGGGKTTVLDAIAEGLKAYLAALKVAGYKQCSFQGGDVKKGEEISDININVSLDYPVKLSNLSVTGETRAGELDGKQENIEVFINVYKHNISSTNLSSKSVIASYNELAKNRLNQDNQIVMPVLAYFGGDSVKIKYDAKDRAKNRIEYIYKNAFSRSRLNYTAIYDWFDEKFKVFRELKDKDSSIKMEEKTPELFKIQKAVEWIMNDGDNAVYKDLRISSLSGQSKLVISKKNTSGTYDDIEINQLSSGEKSLFAFVADLGLRLLHATPLTTSVEADSAYKILGKGIVLIDEVDLHLHLSWQQKVIEKLMEIFPDVQFVMSAHSLLILGKLRSNNVRLFLDNELYSIPEMYGQDIGTIIEKIWKIPSNIFKHRIREVYRLLATNVLGNLLAAKAEVENIEKEIGNSTPALVEAKAIIKHKEKALLQ